MHEFTFPIYAENCYVGSMFKSNFRKLSKYLHVNIPIEILIRRFHGRISMIIILRPLLRYFNCRWRRNWCGLGLRLSLGVRLGSRFPFLGCKTWPGGKAIETNGNQIVGLGWVDQHLVVERILT